MSVIFPRRVFANGVSSAAFFKDKPTGISNLNDVLNYNKNCSDAVITGPVAVDFDDNPIESYWLGSVTDPVKAEFFLNSVDFYELLHLLDELEKSQFTFTSVIEKMLFQRDIYQAFYLFDVSSGSVKKQELVQIANVLAGRFAKLWNRLKLSELEYHTLQDLKPTDVDDKYFVKTNRFRLEDNYLPQQAVSKSISLGWHDMSFVKKASQHFKRFSGRSFLHLYIKPPGMAKEEFDKFWDNLNRTHADNLHLTTNVPPLPAGTETLLVRSLGVFLEDGTYVDSGFPEEVLMRIFKYTKQTFDLTTSDYRGTIFYHYKMSRPLLLAKVSSFGLCRHLENVPEFVGFFSEAPDPATYGGGMVTMRTNCIGCHSELLYGTNTVFSLENDRPKNRYEPEQQDGMLKMTDTPNRYWLNTKQHNRLTQYLRTQQTTDVSNQKTKNSD